MLARECDFFSIGTNDLTQYTLAVDRGNEHVAHLFDPLHPAVLTLIDSSARAAARAGIPITLCGEMASNPLAIPILVGLGIEELSGTPAAVPIMKEIVHALEFGVSETDARRAVEAGSADEVRAIGAARLREANLLAHPRHRSLARVRHRASSTEAEVRGEPFGLAGAKSDPGVVTTQQRDQHDASPPSPTPPASDGLATGSLARAAPRAEPDGEEHARSGEAATT